MGVNWLVIQGAPPISSSFHHSWIYLAITNQVVKSKAQAIKSADVNAAFIKEKNLNMLPGIL